MADLAELHGIIPNVKQTEDVGVTLSSELNLEALVIIAYGDSSFAHAQEERTQVGLIMAVSDSSIFARVAAASIIDWRSVCTHRRVRSTLSAEATACDEACDHAYFAGAWLGEVLHARRATRARRQGHKAAR